MELLATRNSNCIVLMSFMVMYLWRGANNQLQNHWIMHLTKSSDLIAKQKHLKGKVNQKQQLSDHHMQLKVLISAQARNYITNYR